MGAGLKRKDVLHQVNDDFSEFSLSSPATKIRRLDAELPPIPEMVEEEEEKTTNPNEERALVVFNPLPTHSPFSFTLHSHLLSRINNNWSNQYDSNFLMSSQEEEKKKQRLALVPWVSPSSSNSHVDDSNNTNREEADAEMGNMDMEIEQQDMDSIANIDSSTSTIHPLNLHHAVSGITPEGFHQWQQQHCFLPQFPQNTSTPITWTR